MVIDKITIAVEKMSAMRDFYSAVLEIEFTALEMFGETLYSAHYRNMEILLCPRSLAGVEAKTNTIQLRLIVENIPQAYHNGLRSGGTKLNEPQDFEGRRLAALRDPDNNSLELISAFSK